MFNIFSFIIFWGVPIFVTVSLVMCIKNFFQTIVGLDFNSTNGWRQFLHNLICAIKSKHTITILSLFMAYIAFVKVDEWLLFQLSDRCLVSNIKINEEKGSVYPMFINQGGDSAAYKSLTGKFDSWANWSKSEIATHLSIIRNNILAVNQYFDGQYFTVDRNKSSKWVFRDKNNQYESWNEFDIPNVIGQLTHPVYWSTRATCAKLLQNVEYIRDIKNFNQANLEILKSYDWKNMFDNLIKNMSDSSLIVRKISLDTYKLWTCQGLEGRLQKECEDKFEDHNIFRFDNAINDWHKQSPTILANFKKILGILSSEGTH